MSKNKFEWAGLHPFSYHPFIFDLVPDLKDKVVVDCGCGKGIYGYLFRATREIGRGKLIGLDINSNRLSFCRKFKVYDKLIKGDISSLPFKNKSVDFLICSEVIEHLEKDKGKLFLKEVDRVMKTGGRAIITTPNINMETQVGDKDAHHSRWNTGDFQAFNYKVIGVGLRISHGYGESYTKPVLALSHTFTFVSYFFPRLAGYLIAFKDF